MRERFLEPGLPRIDGEVSRPHLWLRIQEYMSGGKGPLYCRPEHADGRPLEWHELLQQGSISYGGVGTTRYWLDYNKPEQMPFADIYRQPRRFAFFLPTEEDLRMPQGVVLSSGRSSLSDDPKRVRFAMSSFNSGKGTPVADMPDENPVYVSPSLAHRIGLKTGDCARLTGRHSSGTVVLPVVVTDRVKGETIYVSFHKCKAEMERGQYVNILTSHEGRCPYCGQTSMKATQGLLEKAEKPAAASEKKKETLPAVPAMRIDTTRIVADMPVWDGQNTPLVVTDILKETHDVTTFRFQGDPLCRFVYYPGQFCSLVLNINGKKVVRSYTISSSPSRPYQLEITVKRVPGGLVSNWLPDNLQIGSRIEVAGPRGKFCLVPGQIPPKILLLGAGSGVTPALSMGRWLCDVSAPVDVKFFNSVRSPEDIIGHHEIQLMALRNKLFAPLILTSTRGTNSAWTGFSGRINEQMLAYAVPDIKERHIYMCGPPPFMDCVRALLVQMNYDLANLHLESFGGVRTSVADKPAPLGAADGDEAPKAGALAIEFAKSGKVAHTDGAATLLEVGEANDIALDYVCRAGNCGDCKVRLLKGEVKMALEDGLTAEDKKAGYILTCAAKPRSACSVDA